jgi:4-diphosphocytidyl-2-C-methyl-D-erythritol kinase
MVKLLAESAPAKINLLLRVVGQRADGYHELDSVFVPISLYDEIRIEVRNAPAVSIELRCDRDDLPKDSSNLAWRAAYAFMREFGLYAGIRIDLHKRIPVGAGLGGGSSDAGAVLRMMAALWHVDNAATMLRLATGLGADVPFFLSPQTAHVSGIGERIVPLSLPAPLAMVIGVPPITVSTAEVFGALRREQWSGPAPREHLCSIAAGQIRPATLQNDLAAVAMTRHAEIAALKCRLESAGAQAASMSGSGGAVFGIFSEPTSAQRAFAQLGREDSETAFYIVSSLV